METIKIVLKNFTRTTSSHGIPQIGYSNSILVRIFWLLIFCTGFAVFTTQAYSLIAKFMKHEKTVTMELRFEAAPFPAVTVCNLNPYKNSLAQQIPSLRETLQVFEHVRKSSKFRAPPTEDALVDDKVRVKRELTYDPVLAFCDCPNINFECTPYLKPREVHPTRCYCFRNRDYQTVSPCYNEKMWTTLDCVECSYTGRCTHPTGKVDPAIRSRKCLCPALANYCVLQKSQIETIGDPMLFTTTTTTSTTSPTSTSTTTTTSTTPTTTTTTSTTSTTTTTTASPSTSTTTEPYTGPTTIDPTMIENLGYGDMTDGVTIATKAMENLLFTIASLDTDVRIGLSYGKHEMINMCSFNGKQCDIENDFTHSIDPVYGNCYIFNYESQHSNRTSSRAGPMYGLRMLVYSNLSDYMPTTEAAGIRVQIHNQSEQSFPDTFGYSAPTGFISSFGIKLKEVDRLDGPYGECLRNGKTADYLFENKSYSTEGCFRSCFQHFLFNICKCADPRFPTPRGGEYCAADNPVARKCLESVLEEVGGFHGINGCDCRQPCKQSGYSVTYSAAVWPAPFFEVGQCLDNDNESCVETYRKNAAMIEIYYEQLNFEKLEESEAYGFVNLLADFGGQLGLWMGFSVITCVEVIILVIKLITVCCCPARDQDVKEVPDTKRLSLLPDHAVQLEQRNKLIAKTNRSDQSIGGKRLIKDNEYCNCH